MSQPANHQHSVGVGVGAGPSEPATGLWWSVLLGLSCWALLWAPGAAGSALNCHKMCICASNIVSCSKMNLSAAPTNLPAYTAVLDLSYNHVARLRADWAPAPLDKLHNLLLSHNGLHFLSSEAFLNVRQLRYLDLSSNALRALDEYIFEPLAELEVLLLYNNHISQIDRLAFSGVVGLQKLYLSQNQVSRFPLELVADKSRPEKLVLLDVSSNRIKALPTAELQALPAWLKNGLYFHQNPLVCGCDLYSLLAHWSIRKLNSALDFKDDFRCFLPTPAKTEVGVFELSGDVMNCSTFKETAEEGFLEQTLTLGCDTKHKDMSKTWLLPGNVAASTDGNQSAQVLPDGSLRISPVRAEDSGNYTCFAVSNAHNETLYVVLKVHNFTMNAGGDSLNTAYTTLVGCLASVVLVLIYLYLTPCPCPGCLRRGKKGGGDDSIHSSMISVTPTHDDPALKAELDRHVAFIDAKDLQGQNGKLNPAGGAEEDPDQEAGVPGKGRRKRSVAESISSVFSDTPMVV